MWEVLYKPQITWNELESLQSSLVLKVKQNPDTRYLLLSEPLPTFTFGRNSDASDLLWNEPELRQKGVTLAAVSRGGKWTYHGPGQIVCYPIVQLSSLGLGPKDSKHFVNCLRQAVLEALWLWNIPAQGQDDPYGIYVETKKLASFGMSFEGGISQHGVALYLSPQIDFFSGIKACGSSDTEFTCVREYQPELSWRIASEILSDFVEKCFKNP